MFTHTALRRAIARSHETPVATIRRIDAGNNHTYRVTLGDGRERFLKVGTRFPDAFPAEPETVAHVRRETAVPVPAVHSVGTEPLGYPFAVYEFVPDAGLDWVRDLSPSVAERLCREAGENLAALHRHTFPAFGRLGADTAGLAVVEPHDYRTQLRRSLDRQLDALTGTPFAGRQGRLATLGSRLVDDVDLDAVQPALVHGDYRVDNLCLDPTTESVTTAVLDWELPTAGDPLWDVVTTLALLTAGYGIDPPTRQTLAAAFWEGYGSVSTTATRWRCYELLAHLRLARHLDVELQALADAARAERVDQHHATFDALLNGEHRLHRSGDTA